MGNPITRPNDEEEIEEKVATIKEAIDNNATDNPHPTIDPATGKMAVVGNATDIEVPNYKYSIEYEYTPDILSPEDMKNCKEEDGKYYLTLTYENKRVKPIYRTKVVLILTRILADALVIDTEGYSSDYIEKAALIKVLDEHLDDVLDIAVMTLGVDKSQLEYMTLPSLADFFGCFLKNEPNIIEECVRFLLRSQQNSEKKQTKKK